jgi:hypothetical protein
MNLPTTKVPMYVLLKDKHPLGPIVVPNQDGTKQQVLFGFSDKGPYDTFVANGPDNLRPYPLVKGYLKGLLSSDDSNNPIVVLDALSDKEPFLNAATVQSVIECMESKSTSIAISLRLDRVADNDAYRIHECEKPAGS